MVRSADGAQASGHGRRDAGGSGDRIPGFARGTEFDRTYRGRGSGHPPRVMPCGSDPGGILREVFVGEFGIGCARHPRVCGGARNSRPRSRRAFRLPEPPSTVMRRTATVSDTDGGSHRPVRADGSGNTDGNTPIAGNPETGGRTSEATNGHYGLGHGSTNPPARPDHRLRHDPKRRYPAPPCNPSLPNKKPQIKQGI